MKADDLGELSLLFFLFLSLAVFQNLVICLGAMVDFPYAPALS